jgi:hypothetical protein
LPRPIKKLSDAFMAVTASAIATATAQGNSDAKRVISPFRKPYNRPLTKDRYQNSGTAAKSKETSPSVHTRNSTSSK